MVEQVSYPVPRKSGPCSFYFSVLFSKFRFIFYEFASTLLKHIYISRNSKNCMSSASYHLVFIQNYLQIKKIDCKKEEIFKRNFHNNRICLHFGQYNNHYELLTSFILYNVTIRCKLLKINLTCRQYLDHVVWEMLSRLHNLYVMLILGRYYCFHEPINLICESYETDKSKDCKFWKR